ncbi:dephospho-CoA kinase [uncultured Dysgonomonas sp.]|uniref:Dephospho-CoA kinase n=1 Tax=uncultured Dysgonomonas sp. TaxID=206096 RepID=A0A212IZU8_9BACT|nr:dephospho-CoA kinase [uncultured Dysgonomonas sp.]SBV92732.1 Dephospho-CoA kinase [uncultured Dysgonomonas sp.]
MIKLGITGGIGSGKSTVSEIFSLCNVPVYIADTESKRLVATSPVIKEKLINIYGEELFEGGVLNKALLASHIFNDKAKLEQVNAIIHPEVEKDFKEWVVNHAHSRVIAHEAAILFESGFNKLMDKIVMVYTPLEIRLERTMKRDHTTREKVLERIHNQMPDEEKAKLSDFVIVNDGAHSLIEQVLDILKQVKDL